MSLDSLSVFYDSEYDNYYVDDNALFSPPFCRQMNTDKDEVTYANSSNNATVANIRSVSENIARNFGQSKSEKDRDVWGIIDFKFIPVP